MDYHQPVLLTEVLDALQPAPNQSYIDGTLGNAGHTIPILQAGGTVYGIDQDASNLNLSTQRINDLGLGLNFHPINDNFANLKTLYQTIIKSPVSGLLLDLGLSKNQIKSDVRGFSFNDQTSLDMRLNPQTQIESAESVINTYDFQQLFDIFSKYAQEKYSKPIILRIIRDRQKSPIKTGKRLADIIRNYYHDHHLNSKIDPATKIFLALRIHVNAEYSNLNQVLTDSLTIVKPTGVVSIISFHSGEDRIVKQFIKTKTYASLIKPYPLVTPSSLEISQNPLCRSAVLRSFSII